MKPLFLLSFVLFTLSSCAQRKRPTLPPEIPKYLNADREATSVRFAEYAVYMKKISDSVWNHRVYRVHGPLVEVLNTSDAAGNIRQGRCYFYSKEGSLDSVVNFRQGLRDGKAYRLKVVAGHIRWLAAKDWRDDKPGRVDTLATEDTLLRKTHPLFFYSQSAARLGLLNDPAAIISDPGAGTAADSLRYTGGRPMWGHFLMKTLRYPEEAVNDWTMGLVVLFVSFDEQGHVVNTIVLSSVAHSLDLETETIYHLADQWVPVSYNGRAVWQYGPGPVSFKLEKGD